MMRKKGQMFILAAIIIVTILVGLIGIKNYASVKKEPAGFYSLSSEIKFEAAKVIDYGIYNNEDYNAKLEGFTEEVKNYLYENKPGAGFVFIYGNESGFVVENYGKEEANVEGNVIPDCGSSTKSTVSLSFSDSSVTRESFIQKSEYGLLCRAEYKWQTGSVKLATLNIKGQDYVFDLSEGKQFIVLMKQETGNETYVDIA